ncbi:T9SS type A sorting domain-containing protein [bacterium]|nr:T9SS type A sorting domain-containing protein [bacterium]
MKILDVSTCSIIFVLIFFFSPTNAFSAGNLSDVKVAILYESIGDGMQEDLGRNIDDQINLIQGTRADMIFRGCWQWHFLLEHQYDKIGTSISAVKNAMPDIIFTGAIPAQALWRTDYNPKTKQYIVYPVTWDMALDPATLGVVGISKVEFQCEYAKKRLWVDQSIDSSTYDPATVIGYFPDITNAAYQELILSWAKKLIDLGSDAIWIDMLFSQAGFLTQLIGDVNDPAVKKSYEAASKIVDELHNYKPGIYVGTWDGWKNYPYPPPMIDFVTKSPTKEEVLGQLLDEDKWDTSITTIREKRGDIPIISFIDWADTVDTPLGVFTNILSTAEQNSFLRVADEFFKKKGIIYSYPVHGGWMGADTAVFSFEKYFAYDSLAPEFQSYETIKELALQRAGDIHMPVVTINSPLDGSQVSGTITIDVSATDDCGISKVEFYVDGALVNTTVDLPYQYLWNTEGITQGDHKIKVIAYDLSGNKTEQTITLQVRKPAEILPGTIVYPNPYIKGKHSKLTFANLTDRTKLEIYSLNGILLYENETTESSYSFVPDRFASGIYILVTRNSKGTKSRKIAIIK